jgi:mono/diheme cytochrome c family protein
MRRGCGSGAAVHAGDGAGGAEPGFAPSPPGRGWGWGRAARRRRRPHPSLAPEAKEPRRLARAQGPVGRRALVIGGIGVIAGLLGWRSAIAPVSLTAPVYSQATIERGRVLAALGDCAVCHTAPGGAPTPAAARWTRPSARSTPPTSRPMPTPASAAGRSAPSSARCAKASRATAITCTRPSRTRPSPRPATTTCRRSMRTSWRMPAVRAETPTVASSSFRSACAR